MEKYGRLLPAHRAGHPVDLAQAALFLVSPLASYVTGSNIVQDGGFMLTLPNFMFGIEEFK